MKKIDLGQTISILANVGVLAGIVFLAIEINQNTRAIERDARVAQANAISGPIINSEYLPGILAKIQAVTEIDPVVAEFMSVFAMNYEEATRWERLLDVLWRTNEASWAYSGECLSVIRLLGFRDHQIYYRHFVELELLDTGYIDCIENEMAE